MPVLIAPQNLENLLPKKEIANMSQEETIAMPSIRWACYRVANHPILGDTYIICGRTFSPKHGAFVFWEERIRRREWHEIRRFGGEQGQMQHLLQICAYIRSLVEKKWRMYEGCL